MRRGLILLALLTFASSSRAQPFELATLGDAIRAQRPMFGMELRAN
jgi:hypothetical protein